MKKYYPVDFDEKGNAVLGTPKNTPTSNSFIPTTWAPGGGSDEGSGIIAISISPALTLTPTLESILPITDSDPDDTIILSAGNALEEGDTYTVTVTPSSDCYAGIAYSDEDFIAGDEKGEPVSVTLAVADGILPVDSVTAVSSITPPVEVAFRTILIQN